LFPAGRGRPIKISLLVEDHLSGKLSNPPQFIFC
jgi:hypothetical protein